MFINDKNQVTYCTNIHPGADWQATFDSLKEFVPGIKKRVAKSNKFGLGLRLSNVASAELNEQNNLAEFKEWLASNDLYVFTMNGFPYGNFHNERVKDMVHAPDWTTQDRLTYTQRLFEQLAYLLPDGMTGGISTSPISYKHWYASEELQHNAFVKGAENLTQIILQLHELEKRTGKHLHLDIEPEPDGFMENSDEVLGFFKEHLLPVAVPILKDTLGDVLDVEELIYRYITVCYDVCHFSLAYEEPVETFEKFAEAGIKIGKIQVSAALKIISDGSDNKQIWEALAVFNEPTYLHQVTEKKDGKVVTYNDLPIVLENKFDFEELRAHFHVPIFLEEFGCLFSTQDHILKVIDILKNNNVSEHLEIETYTWDVLPKELKKDISESIIREINWLTERL